MNTGDFEPQTITHTGAIRLGEIITPIIGPTECELLRMRLLLWKCVFQKYESFKANGITNVPIDDVINDYRYCHAITEDIKIQSAQQEAK